jgi:hypothetical protein
MKRSTSIRFLSRLLPLTCLGVALGALPSCQRDECGVWSEPEPLELGVQDDLHAIAVDPYWKGEGPLPFHAVGAGGLIVEARDEIRTHRPVEVDLHGVAVSDFTVIAVGDAGTVVRAPSDGSGEWQIVDVGVTADLHAIVPLAVLDLVLGDGVLIVHDHLSDTWTLAPPPLPGWGSLRAAFRLGEGTYYAVGLAGAAWSTHDPLAAWARVDLDTNEDLLVGKGGDAFIAGTRGTRRVWLGDEWKVWDRDNDRDFIAGESRNLLLAADGSLVGGESVASATLSLITDLGPGMAAMGAAWDGGTPGASTLIVVGAKGRALRLESEACGYTPG